MSEIDCFGTPLSIGEVVPGWHLVQLLETKPENPNYLVNSFVMREGDFGLTFCNDPSFVFSMPPMAEASDDCSDEDWQAYLPTLMHYRERLNGAYALVSYKLVDSCVKAGFDPNKAGLACWLADRMYKVLEDYKNPLKVDKTYEELITLYLAGEAILTKDDINRLTFKYNNILYICRWSSERNSTGTGVVGWCCYKVERG